MRRRALLILMVVALVSALGAPASSHEGPTEFTYQATNSVIGAPGGERVLGAWAIVYNLPLGGTFTPTLEDGTTLPTATWQHLLTAKLSLVPFFGNGFWFGPMRIDGIQLPGEDPMSCVGKAQGPRIDFVDRGRFTLRCEDGSTMRASLNIVWDPANPLPASWTVTGAGAFLNT